MSIYACKRRKSQALFFVNTVTSIGQNMIVSPISVKICDCIYIRTYCHYSN